jgi:effector-binding domain-containing protein
MLEPGRIVQTNAQTTAVIRLCIPRAEIIKVMGAAIHEVLTTLSTQGIAPTGPVFSHHFRIDPEIFDFEVGVPVKAPVKAIGRVVASQLPAARVARSVYHGSYEGLGAAWGEFKAWIAAEGLASANGLWERYILGPEVSSDPAQWQTELNCPLQG